MITCLGLGTKQAPANTNLDPQRQFWSWLSAFKNPDELGDSGHHERAYFSGFACTQTSPAGMSIQIGGGDDVDSAAIFINSDRAVLLSTDGAPQTVTIPTAPASGSRIDAIVSYIDTTSPDAEAETPGTPEYVHTIVVPGTASSSPSAPTDAQIVSALPAGANSKYYRWCDVRVAQGTTTITNSNITDRKPDAPEPYWTGQDIQAEAKKVVLAAPDYSSYTSITSNSWVVPRPGFLWVSALCPTTTLSRAYCSVNGNTLFNAQVGFLTNSGNIQLATVLPVHKGDTVNFYLEAGASWNARRFFDAQPVEY